MKKKYLIILAAACLAIIMAIGGCRKKESVEPVNSAASTMEKMADGAAQTAEGVEQTTCPVMGGKINKDIFTEYKGKKVYFCCPACKPEFEKNPEKYISKLPQFQK